MRPRAGQGGSPGRSHLPPRPSTSGATLSWAGAALAVVLATPAWAGDGTPLGADLLGQECHGQSRAATVADPRLPPPLDVYCGAWPQPGGTVRAAWFGAAPAARAAVAQAAADSPLAADIALRLACAPGQWTVAADSGESLVAACRFREGGWPAVTITAVRHGLLVFAEGTPANLPALHAALGALTPDQPGPAAAKTDAAATIRRLEATAQAAPGLYDSGQAAAYRDLTELARLYNGMGDHAMAEQTYRKAFDLQRGVMGEADPGLGDTVMHLALEVSNQGRFVEAAELFRQAEPLVQKSVDPLDQPRLTSYLALSAANRHTYAEARDLARQATAARRILAGQGGGADRHAFMNGYLARGEEVHSLLIESGMSLKLNDMPAAAAAAAEALAITDEVAGLPGGWKTQAMALKGEVDGRQGRARDGEALLTEAVAQNRRLFGSGMPTIMALAALGRFHADQGRFAEAMEDFRQEFALLAARTKGGARLGFDAVAPFFLTALELADQPGSPRDRILDEVFSVAQMVQGGAQADSVAHAALKFAANDERVAALIREQHDAQRRRDETRLTLATEAAKPQDQRSAEREAWLAEQYRAAQAKMDAAQATLQRAFPEYARLANPAPVTVARLRALLPPGDALVTFAFGDDFGVAVVVTPDAVLARRLDVSRAQLAADVAELRAGVVVHDGRVGRYDLALAHRLYAQLFAPLGPALAASRHLMVVADGALSSLPAAALVASAPTAATAPAEADWLVRHAAVSQWPSVAALVAMRGHAGVSAAPLPFLGVGNPRFAGTAKIGLPALADHCRSDGPLPAALLAALAPLPDTATELRRVAQTLGARPEDVLLDAGATETALRAQALDRYRVLYFATHGLLPAELRCQSEPALALTPPPAAARTKAEDGLLEASEIAALHLDADLVVLSACNTASAGGRFGGEALSSLADVFFHAGARSVLASHWPVPSASTTRLMTGVFDAKAAAPDQGYAHALQQAQLALLADPATAHPVHWAGFALIGGGAAALPQYSAPQIPGSHP